MGDDLIKAPEDEFSGDGPKLKPLTADRQREIEQQMKDLKGVSGASSFFKILFILIGIGVVAGIFFFVQKSRFEYYMSNARSDFLYVYDMWTKLRDLPSGHKRPGDRPPNMSVLERSEENCKNALKIFPKDLEARYLLYNIYQLKLLVIEAEVRVYGTQMLKNYIPDARMNRNKALASLEEIDPGLKESRAQFEDKYIKMSKKKLGKYLNRLKPGFTKDEDLED